METRSFRFLTFYVSISHFAQALIEFSKPCMSILTRLDSNSKFSLRIALVFSCAFLRTTLGFSVRLYMSSSESLRESALVLVSSESSTAVNAATTFHERNEVEVVVDGYSVVLPSHEGNDFAGFEICRWRYLIPSKSLPCCSSHRSRSISLDCGSPCIAGPSHSGLRTLRISSREGCNDGSCFHTRHESPPMFWA